jgi:hypothetical protein
MRHT